MYAGQKSKKAYSDSNSSSVARRQRLRGNDFLICPFIRPTLQLNEQRSIQSNQGTGLNHETMEGKDGHRRHLRKIKAGREDQAVLVLEELKNPKKDGLSSDEAKVDNPERYRKRPQKIKAMREDEAVLEESKSSNKDGSKEGGYDIDSSEKAKVDNPERKQMLVKGNCIHKLADQLAMKADEKAVDLLTEAIEQEIDLKVDNPERQQMLVILKLVNKLQATKADGKAVGHLAKAIQQAALKIIDSCLTGEGVDVTESANDFIKAERESHEKLKPVYNKLNKLKSSHAAEVERVVLHQRPSGSARTEDEVEKDEQQSILEQFPETTTKERAIQLKELREKEDRCPSFSSFSQPTASSKTRAASLLRKNVLPDNPLQMSNRSAMPKQQRLAMLGKDDSWPEYSEEPSSDSIQALRKSLAELVPSASIDVLLPQSGLRTHEDCISGCDLLSKAIWYSRDNDDSSFLEMLDFIFKWAACAILLRNHTSGFRKLLSTILELFERLDELSYAISDGEAHILLPYLLDKASVAKVQFKEEILAIFALATKNVYPSKKFGPVCMKVFEKSKLNPSRTLAAELCTAAVRSAGVPAIGRKGLVILSNALNEETIAETKKVYIGLFEATAEKLKGGADKLCEAINPTDNVKAMIMERCAKQPVAIQGSSRRSPPRKNAPRVGQHSPMGSQEAPTLSSSAVVTGNLRARLQKSKETKLTEEAKRLPPSIDTTSTANLPSFHSPRTTSIDMKYIEIIDDITCMTSKACKATDIVRGTDALRLLRSLISNSDGSIDHIEKQAFCEKIESNYNYCVDHVARALEFAFDHEGKNAPLPTALINETISTLAYLLRMRCCRSKMSEKTVEHLVKVTVSALLDERIHINSDIVKATNKVCTLLLCCIHFSICFN